MTRRLWCALRRRARAAPWQVIHFVSEFRPVAGWRARSYRRAVLAHAGSLPTLSDRWSPIVAMLRERGVAQSDLRDLDLSGADEMVAAARILVDAWRVRLREQARAGVDFLMVPASEIFSRPEIFRFGLHPDLLRLAEAHIGLPVAYDGVTVQYTVADGRQVSTRDWHRDREDRRMVKLAIYLNDVDDAGGPFELLPLERDEDGAFYLGEAENRQIAESGGVKPVTCTGAAGTVVFADTARFFHRGKPATGQDRAAIFFSYFAHPPKNPHFCERSGLSRAQIWALTEGMAVEQRAAALWQRALPLHRRVIPPAAL